MSTCSSQIRILAVDDHALVRDGIAEICETQFTPRIRTNFSPSFCFVSTGPAARSRPRWAVVSSACCYWQARFTPSIRTNIITQYMHTSWRIQDGSLPSGMYSITQTSDGFLWFVSLPGDIYRFDGVRFVPWHLPAGVGSAAQRMSLPTAQVGFG